MIDRLGLILNGAIATTYQSKGDKCKVEAPRKFPLDSNHSVNQTG